MELTYSKCGDYYLPDLCVPETKYEIGKYGMMRRTYLKEHHKGIYSAMLMNGTLLKHLEDVDNQAEELRDTLLPKYKKQYGATEELKSKDQMKWVQRMNTLSHQIEEIICSDIIYGGAEV